MPIKPIYFQAPPQPEEVTRPNLEKVSDLVEDGGHRYIVLSTVQSVFAHRLHLK
jgi:NEDD8-activating enzyme E1